MNTDLIPYIKGMHFSHIYGIQTTHAAVNLITFFQEKLRQIGAILTCYACNKSSL